MSGRPSVERLYLQMCRIRQVEEAIGRLWRAGSISGEMHLGMGEEAVAAGVIGHVEDGDALALDYRSTPPLVARGVPLEAILRELLGHEAGLNGGCAGHMHLMSREHLAAASGIVGAPAPLACGFGLAAQLGDAGRIAVAFFGDGAINAGMLMESLNLAAVWRLPIVFVCKDNRWAVTTRSRVMTGGGIERRVRGFGIPLTAVDGMDVLAVWRAARQAVQRARQSRGPTFLLARVDRLQGHFLGDKLLSIATHPREMGAEMGMLLQSVRVARGAPTSARLRSVAGLSRTIATAGLDAVRPRRDPLKRARRRLPSGVAGRLEEEARAEVAAAVESVRAGAAHADG